MRYMIISLLLTITFSIKRSSAQPVTLSQLGKTYDYFQMAYPVQYKGALYTFHSGALYRTDLGTGERSRLGNTVFTNIRFFFAIYNRLYMIETDGSMTEIDPLTGASSVKSSIDSWVSVMQVIAVGNSLYSFENGVFYKHAGLDPKIRKQIGKDEFYTLGSLYRSDSRLFSIISDVFYEINTSDGEWRKISKSKTWKSVRAGAIFNDKFYSIDNPGILCETNLADGIKKELDNTQFIKGGFMFAEAGKLYEIIDGTLFEITIQ